VKNKREVLIRLQIKPFSLFPYFHWANYTLNKTFSLEGKKPKTEETTRVRNWGEPEPKTGKGEVAPDFDPRFRGIEATG